MKKYEEDYKKVAADKKDKIVVHEDPHYSL